VRDLFEDPGAPGGGERVESQVERLVAVETRVTDQVSYQTLSSETRPDATSRADGFGQGVGSLGVVDAVVVERSESVSFGHQAPLVAD
jgi:hypothetical protein